MKPNAAASFYLLRESEDPLTTSVVADLVFGADEDLRNAERKVRYYFEESYDHLVVCDTKDGTTVYEADEDKVWTGEGVMNVATSEAEIVQVRFGHVLVYIDGGGVPQTVQLRSGEHDLPEMGSGVAEDDF